MSAVLHYLKTNKRFWIPPIVIFYGLLSFVAWKAARTAGSPFEYSLW